MMYWQFNDNRQRFAPGILPQQQAYYDIPVVHGRQEMTNFALSDEDSGEVKRPMNSFLLWAKVMRKKYAKENPTMHNAEISKLLGKVWNGMTTSEKRPYVERAEKLRVIHMRDHPNYRYAPRKKKDRKQAQRMISPEIAAAFHNAIFDLKNVAAPERHGKDEGGNKQSCDYIMLTGRRDELQSMLYENSKSKAHYGNMGSKFLVNGSANSGSTFHYYAPENKLGFKVEPVSEIGEELLRQHGLERKTRQGSQVTAMSYDRQMSACSGQSLPSSDTPRSWCDASSIADSDGSTMLPSSPESISDSFDQEVPPFLRALLDFPLHVDSRRISSNMDQGVPDERSQILNDFGDIVGKEGDGTNTRKPCMFL